MIIDKNVKATYIQPLSQTTIVVHNKDRLYIYENPLMELAIMDLMVNLEKLT